MKNLKVFAISMALVLSLVAGVFAITKLTARTTAQTAASCCNNASCCEGGTCKMGGSCCAKQGAHAENHAKMHDAKLAAAGVSVEDAAQGEGKSCHQKGAQATTANGEKKDCCANGAACCNGGACCKSKKAETTAIL